MTVGGLDHVVGYKPMQLGKFIEEHHRQDAAADLTLTKGKDTVSISAPVTSGLGDTVVQLVRYTPSETVKIRRGENAGRTITYHNIVTEWQLLGTWDGSEALEITADAAGDEPIVVLLQRPGNRAILAAARIR